MKWLFRTLGSVVAALVVSAGAAVSTAIWLMFSAGSAEGRRLGYFDAIFVDVNQTPQGTTQLGVGINDPIPLVVTVIVLTVLILAVMVVHDQLRARRKQLLADTE
ncbi:hypothetical protein [Microbacterium sp. SA39]|uniref:hypothetical protein n=1 Tax=Microbacterium sp. SA39 TaxID=1263625 RepID=UPI00061FC29D|nr:hypothetical protein [Microbacterium sp. SA39]KJQ53239.1 hypothetical protein RS85_02753 [Microbacterium sp. SA39]